MYIYLTCISFLPIYIYIFFFAILYFSNIQTFLKTDLVLVLLSYPSSHFTDVAASERFTQFL